MQESLSQPVPETMALVWKSRLALTPSSLSVAPRSARAAILAAGPRPPGVAQVAGAAPLSANRVGRRIAVAPGEPLLMYRQWLIRIPVFLFSIPSEVWGAGSFSEAPVSPPPSLPVSMHWQATPAALMPPRHSTVILELCST